MKTLLSGLLFGLIGLPFILGQTSIRAADAQTSSAPDFAGQLEAKPPDPYFDQFKAKKAAPSKGLLLKPGDRLAICGDSITEQKMYSRIIETYLTVAVPDLNVTVRQYGWSGETAPGFLARMTNDCLRFMPAIATTCYGMNDHGYRPYEESIGQRYREASTAITRAFKQAGTRVVLGSAGCVGKRPQWSKDTNATTEALNVNLCELRNIDLEIAQSEGCGFADVFWPMLKADFAARQKYGQDYAVAGKDGVHPDWAGQTIMAYAFLRGLGLDGEIGTFTIDLRAKTATASQGHTVLSFKDGELTVKSERYPFCAPEGDTARDNSIRSGMTLVPFNPELNRLMLVVKNPQARGYKVTWGDESHSYSTEQLSKGVNLAADFANNPFSSAFTKVDLAVAAKQGFETWQIKQMFHGELGRLDMDRIVDLTEKARSPLAKSIHEAFIPVTHVLQLVAE